MSIESLIGFREQQHARGISTTPELDQVIARIGEKESDAIWYAKQSWLVRWWHRRHCLEVHNGR